MYVRVSNGNKGFRGLVVDVNTMVDRVRTWTALRRPPFHARLCQVNRFQFRFLGEDDIVHLRLSPDDGV